MRFRRDEPSLKWKIIFSLLSNSYSTLNIPNITILILPQLVSWAAFQHSMLSGMDHSITYNRMSHVKHILKSVEMNCKIVKYQILNMYVSIIQLLIHKIIFNTDPVSSRTLWNPVDVFFSLNLHQKGMVQIHIGQWIWT